MSRKTATNAVDIHSTDWDAPTPLLDSIDSPAHLRALEPSKLPELCSQIRRRLVRTLSANPGHFASSMGAVELTVALHYVFDTPRDRLVWDVGHQAYAHKIITGRRRQFGTLRQGGGLSGFPNPAESEYDTFTAGHASNSISAALGMAVATRLKGDDPKRHTVAIIGDASISGGLAFEGINNAANTPNNLLVVLNDNDMSIDHNVGALNRYLTHINTSPAYNTLRYKAYHMLKALHLVNERRRGAVLRFNNSLKSLLARQQNLFEGLNIRYFGPFDGHDIGKIIRVLRDIKDLEGPKILHLRTVKGKGYAPAEADPSHWHAPGRFDPSTGQRHTGGARKMQDVFGDRLTALAGRDPRIVAITAAMPSGTSVSTMATAYPDRVFDVGISEGHAVTFAGGLAREGLRPVVAIYSSFLQRGYDHIMHDVALQHLPVVFAIDRAGLVGDDGPTHHGTADLGYLRTIPGMTIGAPRDGRALESMLDTAVTHDGPIALRYPRGAARDAGPEPDVPTGHGQILLSHPAPQAVVLTLGTVAADALEAAAAVNAPVTVIDMAWLKPLDTALLEQHLAPGLPVITVEDAATDTGLGASVARWIARTGRNNPLTTLGIPHDRFVPHDTVENQKRQCGFDVRGIRLAIESALSHQQTQTS